MDAPTPAGPGPGFDDLAATAARLADLATLLAARLERSEGLEQRIVGVTGLVQATHEELGGVRAELTTIDERLTAALAAVTRTSTRIDLLTEQSLDAAAGIAANVSRSVETSTASAAQAGRVAERMWADVTRALAAFSGEATQAVGAVAARVDQAEPRRGRGDGQRTAARGHRPHRADRHAPGRAAPVADQVATGLGPAPLDITEDVRHVVAGELETLATTTAEAIEAAVASAQTGTEAAASLAAGLEEIRRVVHEAEGRQDAQLRQAITALRSANTIASDAAAGVAERLAGDASLALGSVRDQLSEAMATMRDGALAAVAELEAATARSVSDASTRLTASTDEAVAALGSRSDALLNDTVAAVGRAAPDDLSRLVRAELLGVRQALRAALSGVEESAAAAAAATAAELTGRLDALEGTTAAATASMSTAVAAVAQRERPEPVEPFIAQMSSDLQAVIASLLSDQLAAIDQRQNVIEDGLRAMWHRLDELDTALGATDRTDPRGRGADRGGHRRAGHVGGNASGARRGERVAPGRAGRAARTHARAGRGDLVRRRAPRRRRSARSPTWWRTWWPRNCRRRSPPRRTPLGPGRRARRGGNRCAGRTDLGGRHRARRAGERRRRLPGGHDHGPRRRPPRPRRGPPRVGRRAAVAVRDLGRRPAAAHRRRGPSRR